MSAARITARDLARIVQAVAPHCHDESAPSLNCVILEARGEHLIATATDRYSAASLRIEPIEPPSPGFRAWVPLRGIKRAAATFRPTRHHCPDILMEVDGGRLIVSTDALGHWAAGASLALHLQPPEEESLASVRRVMRAAHTAAPGETVAPLNPFLLARFAGVRGDGVPAVMWSAGEHKPWAVAIGDDFRAAVHPMRYVGGPLNLADDAEWAWGEVAP